MGKKEMLNAAKGVIETLRSVRDHFQRDFLLSELSNLTGLRRELLDKSIGEVRHGEQNTPTPESKLIVPPDQNPERELLRALLSNPLLIAEAMESVAAEQFEHPGLRAIYLALEQDYLAGRPPSAEKVIDKLADPVLRAFLAEASLSAGTQSPEAAREEMQECITLLIKRIITREREVIESQLRQPGRSVADNRPLMERLVELTRQLQALKIR
jgi:DNA primase